MKKLVLMAAAIVAVSFASCGNKAANAETEATDSVAVEETVVEEVVEVAEPDTVAAGDSTAVVAEN